MHIHLSRRKTGMVILPLLLGLFNICTAQLRVPFTSRTSQYSPAKKTYRIKGDFTMLGNTNLTLKEYGDATNNNYNLMKYVDVDADPQTWNSSSADLTFSTENNAVPTCSHIVYAGLYWTGKTTPDSGIESPQEFSVTKIVDGDLVTKTFNKRNIFLKGPGASAYTKFTAAPDAIYYPNSNDAFIYSAYIEVTDYVRQNGLGTYFAADIALSEGNGEGTGYSGGWGMVVVYENSKMKQRDISLFDGHAFALSTNTNGFNMEVNGFHTVSTGPVTAKVGVMASEGDVDLNGDYFQIQKDSDLSFLNLHHSGNSDDNFFNSTINTGNIRNPNLVNNSGIDIGMFEIPNTNSAVIGNNQTATNFRYGTNGDTYAVFEMALAVDSYLPETENIVSLETINNMPATGPSFTTLPGQEMGFNVDVRNFSEEAINGYKIVVPIPYNTSYIAESAVGTVFFNGATPSPNVIIFDPTIGVAGSLVWNFGTLPVPQNPETLLAKLSFKLKATENCSLLKNMECDNTISVSGFSEGLGAVSGIQLDHTKFIIGHSNDIACYGERLEGAISIGIDAADFVGSSCQDACNIRNFTFCNSSNTVSIGEIGSYFPPGTSFYDSYPIAQNSIQYTVNTSLPIQGSDTLFYAVPPNVSQTCTAPFTISNCIAVNAQDNIFSFGCSAIGIAGNVLTNDSVNGIACSTANISLALVSDPNPNIILNLSNGDITILNGLSPGTYLLQYKITLIENSAYFAMANITINVADTDPPITPALPAITQRCSVLVAPPTTVDACAGIVVGTTTDNLYYDFPGNYTINWIFNDGNGNNTNATQNIEILSEDSLVPMFGYAGCNSDNDASVNIDLNSFLSSEIQSGGIWSDVNNTHHLTGTIFSPYQVPVGWYQFRYLAKEGGCAIAAVNIEVDNDCIVEPACNLLVHNAFSPNNDGENEIFTIENIDQFFCFPTNSVSIFNRWGALVFETEQYDNVLHAFRGISEGPNTIKQSDKLPAGTYFYIIDYTDANGRALKKQGYLYLTR